MSNDQKGLLTGGNHGDPNYKGHNLPSDIGSKTRDRGQRTVTDTFCCGLFIVGWIVTIIIAIFAFNKGDPTRLAQPYDADNHACGRDDGFQDYPYIYFAKPNATFYNAFRMTVCVAECPTNQTDPDVGVGCKPNSIVSVCRASANPAKPGLEIYATTPFMGKICVPTDKSLLKDVRSGINSDDAANYWGSLADSRKLLWYAILIALGIGFVYMAILRFAATPLVWFSIAATIIIIFLAGLFLILDSSKQFDRALEQPDAPTGPMYQALHSTGVLKRIGGILLLIASFIILIAIIYLRKSVTATIGVLKAATSFVATNPFLFLWPLLTFLLFLGTIVWFFTVALYLFSSGELIHDSLSSSPFPVVKFDRTLKTLFWFDVIFGVFNLTFNVGLTNWVLASCACIWYYNESVNKFTESAFRAFRFHIGSIGYGAFILAIVWPFAWIVDLIALGVSKCKGSSNRCLSFMARCCMCVFDCYFRFLRFFTSGAYPLQAVTGENFLGSGRHAVYLTLRNTGPVVVALPMVEFFTWVGKAFITLTTVWIGYMIMTRVKPYKTVITFQGLPCFAIGLVGYFVASLFMSVYAAGAQAILYCLVIDLDLKQPVKKPEIAADFK